MTDPIQTRAAEPAWATQRRPPQRPADEPTVPTDTVDLSPEARAALPPVEGSQAPAPGEDATHTPPEEDTEGPTRELSDEDKQLVSLLRARDMEVRAHEAAHISASGGLAGGASYTHETGPDGKRYAIGGEVRISSPRTTDPTQALANAERMRAAALAPAAPSSQDRAVAARATAMATRARAALAEERAPQTQDTSKPNTDGTDDVDGTKDAAPPEEKERPARMGGPTAFGPAEHLHSDGCGYCSASVARYRLRR